MRPLRWIQLLGFSSPTLAFAGHEITFRLFLPFFLSQAAGISLAAVAVLYFGFQVWDTLTGPVIGYVSDHWPAGWHRRFSPMFWGTPLAMVGTALLFFGVRSLDLAFLVPVLLFTSLGWTLVNIPHGAWALEYAADPVERTRIFASRSIVAFVAVPLFSFTPALLEHLYGAHTLRDGEVLASIILFLLPLTLLTVWIAMRPDRACMAAVQKRPFCNEMMRLARLLLERRNWLVLVLFACLGVHMSIKSSLVLFWVHHALNLPQWGWSLILLQSIAGLLATPLWLQLEKRSGTRTNLAYALAVSLIAALLPIAIPAGSVFGLLFYSVISGAVAGAAFMLARVLLGDLLDDQNPQGSGPVSGQVYSGFHLVFNLAAALTMLVALQVLAVSGFQSSYAVQPHNVSQAIIWVMVVGAAVPAGLGLAAILLLRR